jgi:GNAT superfamily N-acetyltransferase
MTSPDADVVLAPLTSELAKLVARWFADDQEGQRRLDTDFYGAELKSWREVERDVNRHGWVGVVGDEQVGFVDLEVDGRRAGFTVYVRREHRRRGIGRQLSRLAAAEGSRLGIAELVGHVERGHLASTRCMVGAGFAQTGEDEFGPVFTRVVRDE